MSAGSPSRKRTVPWSKWTLLAAAGDQLQLLGRRARRRRARRAAGRQCVSIGRLLVGRADRGQLLGHVDPDRAPGDAAPAADAAGGAELVVPGAELVRQPLAVARAAAGPDRAAVDVASSRPSSTSPRRGGARRVWPVEVGDVLDARAEAGRADHRAVAAGEAALGDLVPARVLEVAREQVAQVGRRRAAGPSCSARALDGGARGLEVGAASPRGPAARPAPRRRARCPPRPGTGARRRGSPSAPGRSRSRPSGRCPSRRRSRCRRARSS